MSRAPALYRAVPTASSLLLLDLVSRHYAYSVPAINARHRLYNLFFFFILLLSYQHRASDVCNSSGLLGSRAYSA